MGWKSIALGVAGLMLASQPALATTQTFTLSVLDPASGVGSGPFGTVTVTENVGGTLTITQTLLPAYRIHDGNANHNAFEFSIIGDPAVTITGLTAGFAAFNLTAGSNVSTPPFADFYTGIDCTTACSNGWGGGYSGTLTFTVGSSNALTLASLRSTAFGGNSVYFATDLVNAAGLTGNVGAIPQTGAVPEPATWGMMLIGFAGIGISLRRRRRADALAAA